MNDSVAKYFSSLPDAIQTGPNLAIPIGGGHGLCASLLSPDDLDSKALEYARILIADSKQLFAADLGCSPFAPQAIRLAEAGMSVDAYDIEEPHIEIQSISERFQGRIRYYAVDLCSSDFLPSPENKYALLYSNRLLSHLKFEDAISLVNKFVLNSTKNARAFLSFSALDSSLGEDYPHRENTLAERFAAPNNDRSFTNQLNSPLCLYTESEVLGEFLPKVGLKVVDIFSSKSGSIKVICEKAA
jgi:hypothetical protein